MSPTKTKTAKPPKGRMARADREEVILDAAEQAFGEVDFRSVAMDTIAERSGVTKALLYQYFGSKDHLYEVCVERARARLFDELEHRVGQAEPGWERLRVFIEHYFDYLEANRDTSWLMYGEASRSVVDEMRERNAQSIAHIFTRAAEEAGRIPDPVGISVLAHGLVGAGEQVGRWWIQKRDVSKQEAVERFLSDSRGTVAAAFAAMEPKKR
jgi:AcrR family transcriptional regulator